MRYLRGSYNFILDRSPEELIGAGLALLALSLIASGVHTLGRRKQIDAFMLTLGTIILTSIASAVVIVGFATDTLETTGKVRYTAENPPPGGFGPGMALGPRIFKAADADKDGRITPKEAADAAEKFVRDADSEKKGSVDLATLSGAINRQPNPPHDSRPGPPPNRFLAAMFVKLVDQNKDGHVTPEEALRFVEEADAGDRGYVDTGDVDALLANRIVPPPRGAPISPQANRGDRPAHLP